MPKSIRARRCPDCCEITFPAPVTIRDKMLHEGGKQCPACRSPLYLGYLGSGVAPV